MATFHERIYILYDEARTQKGVGRKAFAALCDVSTGQLNGWLNRTGGPDTETLKKVARNLDVSVSWLIGANDVRAPYDYLVNACSGLTKPQLRFLTSFAKYLQREK